MYELKRIIKEKRKRSKVKRKMKMILKWLCFVTILLLLVATTIGKSFTNIYTTNVREPHNSTTAVISATSTTTTTTTNKNNNSIYKDVLLEVGKTQITNKNNNNNIIVQEKKNTNSATGIDPPKFSFLHSSAKLPQTHQPQIPYSPSSLSSYIPPSSATSLLLLSSSSSVSNYNTNITNNLNGNNIINNDGSVNNFGISDLAKAMEKKLKNIRNVELGCSTVQVSTTLIFFNSLYK